MQKGAKMAYIILEGSSPELSAVFEVLGEEPQEELLFGRVFVSMWRRVRRLSDNKEFLLGTGAPVDEVPERLLGLPCTSCK